MAMARDSPVVIEAGVVSDVIIRHARSCDAGAVAAIWNPRIRETVFPFEHSEYPVDEIARMIDSGAGRTVGGSPRCGSASLHGTLGDRFSREREHWCGGCRCRRTCSLPDSCKGGP